MHGLDLVWSERLCREILEIESDDDGGVGVNRGGENVLVILVRELHGVDQGVISLDQAIPRRGIHQSSCLFKLLSFQIASILEKISDPLIVNAIGPLGAYLVFSIITVFRGSSRSIVVIRPRVLTFENATLFSLKSQLSFE